ncbi:MAG TPA: hypothetical protein VIN61_02650 [Gammaproteobacteria bacterium]
MSSRPPSHDRRALLARAIELRYRLMRRRREERRAIDRHRGAIDPLAFEDVPYRVFPPARGPDAARALLETMAEVAALLARGVDTPGAPSGPRA